MLEFLTPQEFPDMHRFYILYLEYASKHFIYIKCTLTVLSVELHVTESIALTKFLRSRSCNR